MIPTAPFTLIPAISSARFALTTLGSLLVHSKLLYPETLSTSVHIFLLTSSNTVQNMFTSASISAVKNVRTLSCLVQNRFRSVSRILSHNANFTSLTRPVILVRQAFLPSALFAPKLQFPTSQIV